MPSNSFLFSAVFRFRKATQEVFSELNGTKTSVNIFPSRTRTLKEIQRGAVEPPHHLAARVHPPGVRAGGVGPTGLPWCQVFAHINPFIRKS